MKKKLAKLFEIHQKIFRQRNIKNLILIYNNVHPNPLLFGHTVFIVFRWNDPAAEEAIAAILSHLFVGKFKYDDNRRLY